MDAAENLTLPFVDVERNFDETTAFEIDEIEEEGVVTGKRRRRKSQGRRVSFAEVTSLHIFPRDDEYETPPRGDEASSPHGAGRHRRSPRIAAKMSDPDKENRALRSSPGSSRAKRRGKKPLSDRTEQGAALKREKPNDWLDPREFGPLEGQAEENTGPVDLRHLSVDQREFDMDDDNITLDSTTFALKLASQRDPFVMGDHGVGEELNFVIHKRTDSSEGLDEDFLDENMSITKSLRLRKSSTESHISTYSIGTDMSLTMQVSAQQKRMVNEYVQGISLSAASHGIVSSANSSEVTVPNESRLDENAAGAGVIKTTFSENVMDDTQTMDMSVSSFSPISLDHEERSITMGIPSLQDLIEGENAEIDDGKEVRFGVPTVMQQVDIEPTGTAPLSGQEDTSNMDCGGHEVEESAEKLPSNDSMTISPSSPRTYNGPDAILVPNAENRRDSRFDWTYSSNLSMDDLGDNDSLLHGAHGESSLDSARDVLIDSSKPTEDAPPETVPADITIQAREREDVSPVDGNTVQVFSRGDEDDQDNLLETDKIRRGRTATQTEILLASDENEPPPGPMTAEVSMHARGYGDTRRFDGATVQVFSSTDEIDDEHDRVNIPETVQISNGGSAQKAGVIQDAPSQAPRFSEASLLSVQCTEPEAICQEKDRHKPLIDASFEDVKQYLGKSLQGEGERPKKKMSFAEFIKLIGIQVSQDVSGYHFLTVEESLGEGSTIGGEELDVLRDAAHEIHECVGSLADSIAELIEQLTATSPAILLFFREASESDKEKLTEQRQRVQETLRMHANKTFHHVTMNIESSFRHSILTSRDPLESCMQDCGHVWKFVEDKCRRPRTLLQTKLASLIAERKRSADLAEQAQIEVARSHLEFLRQRSETLKLNLANQNLREQRTKEILDGHKQRLEQSRNSAATLRNQVVDKICTGDANLARPEVVACPYNYVKKWKEEIYLHHELQNGFEVRLDGTESGDKVIILDYCSLLKRRYTVRKAANVVNVLSSSWTFDSEKIAEIFPKLEAMEGFRLVLSRLAMDSDSTSQPYLKVWKQMYGPVITTETSRLSRHQDLDCTLEKPDVRTSMQATRRLVLKVMDLVWEASNCEDSLSKSCRGDVLAIPRFQNKSDCKFNLEVEIIDIVLSVKLLLSLDLIHLPLNIFPFQTLPDVKLVFCPPAIRHLCCQASLDESLAGVAPGYRGLHRTMLAVGSFLSSIRDGVKNTTCPLKDDS